MRNLLTAHLKGINIPAVAALSATAMLTVLILTDAIALDVMGFGLFGNVLIIGGLGGFIWRQWYAPLVIPLMSLASLIAWAVCVHTPADGAPESSEPVGLVAALLLGGVLYLLMIWGAIVGSAIGRLLWPPSATDRLPRLNTLRQHADHA